LHSALVMQDKETDSYWSIMTGDSLAELPLGVKSQWKDWVASHPDTVVLSVEGADEINAQSESAAVCRISSALT
jgi:hypothetical protein